MSNLSHVPFSRLLFPFSFETHQSKKEKDPQRDKHTLSGGVDHETEQKDHVQVLSSWLIRAILKLLCRFDVLEGGERYFVQLARFQPQNYTENYHKNGLEFLLVCLLQPNHLGHGSIESDRLLQVVHGRELCERGDRSFSVCKNGRLLCC